MTVSRDDYAQLSTAAYVNPSANQVGVPTGWSQVGSFTDPLSGFSAIVAQKDATAEIVIAYSGTDFDLPRIAPDFIAANIPAALGLPAIQVIEAMALYMQVKNDFGPGITMTGHSLGGGLAGLMGVLFDRPATTFAPAPFGLTALNPALIANYAAGLAIGGLVDPSLVSYIASLGISYTDRSANVTAYSVEDEIVSRIPHPPTVRIGEDNTILIGTNELGASARHSMALHAALLKSDLFTTITRAFPKFLMEIFDDTLEAQNVHNSEKADFLQKLMMREWGQGDPALKNKVLDAFATNALELIGTQGVAQTTLKDSMLAANIEYFHNYAVPLSYFVSDGGALSFGMTDLGDEGRTKASSRLVRSVRELLAPAERAFANGGFSAEQWHVQTGNEVLDVTGDGRKDVVIGGNQADVANGGDEDDVLVGQGGNDVFTGGSGDDSLVTGDDDDTLTGGTGNDFLVGGAGNDTYTIGANEGSDRITDSDGQGEIDYLGDKLEGGKQISNEPGVWESADERFRFRLVVDSHTLVISAFDQDVSSGTIVVRDFQNGNLGIQLSDETVEHQYTQYFGTTGSDNEWLGDPTHPSIGTAQANEEVFGFGGADYITVGGPGSLGHGGDGNDFMVDNYADQTLNGDAGDDIIVASMGNDELNGGEGNDALQGGSGDDILDGGEGNDFIDGGLGADLIFGGDGNDYIIAGGNLVPAVDKQQFAAGTQSWISGDAVNGFQLPGFTGQRPDTTETGDVFYVVLAGDTGNDIDAGAGNDFVDGGEGTDRIDGGDGDDTIRGLTGDDYIEGGAGDDLLRGDGTQGDYQHATVLTWYALPQFHGDDYIDGGDGNDDIAGDGGSDTIFGGEGNDHIDGDNQLLDPQYHGDDYLDGEGGNDELIGLGGDDQLFGGDGNDRLFGDGNADETQYTGDDYLDGGAGDDYLLAGSGEDTVFAGGGDDVAWGLEGDDFIELEDGADYAEGGKGDDTISGGAGDDTIYGGSRDPDEDDGDDSIDGGAGGDYLRGGKGSDELIGGAGDDILGGDDGDDVLYGDEGNDQLYGGAGNDSLLGGEGDDLLVGEEGDDTLDGGAGDNRLEGGAGNDTLNGGGGNETIDGGAGNDVLNGGGGANELRGGTGDDTYNVAFATATEISDFAGKNGLNLTTPLSQFQVSQDAADETTLVLVGSDNAPVVIRNGLIHASFDFAASDTTVDQEQLLDSMSSFSVNGDSGDDDIIATGGNDLVGGGGGDDRLRGARGDDVLAGGEGDDTLDGGVGDDILLGGEGDDTFEVNIGGGHDEIMDTGGENKIRFGAGIDVSSIQAFIEGDGDIRLALDANTEVKIVDGLIGTVASYEFADGTTLTNDEFMAATLQGDAPTLIGDDAGNNLGGGAGMDNIFGRGGDDRLSGGGGNDTLNGGWGNDVLTGGTGDDALAGGEDDDTYVINAGDGTDSIADTEGANTIRFGSGIEADAIAAHIEPDSGGGTDTLVLDYGSGSVNIADGVANPMSSYTFADGSVLTQQDLFLTAMHGSVTLAGTGGNDNLYGQADADVLSGGAGSDTLHGGSGADQLDGGDDNDILDGGGGDDVLTGGDGFDTYVFGAKSGHDRVTGEQGVNRILLDSSVTLAQIQATRNGQDAILSTNAGPVTASLVLENYFDAAQGWYLQDANGSATGLASLLNDGSASDPVDAYRFAFKEKLHAQAGVGTFDWDGSPLSEGTVTRTDANGDPNHYVFAIQENVVEPDEDGTIYASGDIVQEDTAEYTGTETITRTFTVEHTQDNIIQGDDQFRALHPDQGGSGAAGGRDMGDGSYATSDGTSFELVSKGRSRHEIMRTTEIITYTDYIDHYDRTHSTIATLDDVRGDDRDNQIFVSGAGKVIDGGAGDDTVVDQDTIDYPFMLDASDATSRKAGDFIYGNAGDDSLTGRDDNDELIGGTGFDTLDGRNGADTYRVFADEDGHDVIDDSGVLRGDFQVHMTVHDYETYNFQAESSGEVAVNEATARAAASIRFVRSDEQGKVRLELQRTPYTVDDVSFAQLSAVANSLDGLARGTAQQYAELLSEGVDPYGHAGPYSEIEADFGGFAGLFDENGLTAAARRALAGGPGAPTLMQVLTPQDTVSFESGIERSNLLVAQAQHTGTDGMTRQALDIRWGGTGGVTVVLANANDKAGYGTEQFKFADGTKMSIGEMAALATGDHAPTLARMLDDQFVMENAPFQYVVPDDAFTDPDAGDVLSYSAKLADGAALPSWLNFDAVTRTLSGVPAASDAGAFNVRITATDTQGFSASDVFMLDVGSTNEPPVAAGPDQVAVDEHATTDNLVPLLLANDSDPDAGDTLTMTAVDTEGTAGTVAFDAQSQSLTYTADGAAQQALAAGETSVDHFTYTVADHAGADSTATVDVTVTGVNDAPIVTAAIDTQAAMEDAAFTFVIPEGAFVDPDAGDTLSYDVQDASGTLPSWLSFDAATRTLSGTPGNSDVGSISLMVTAIDGAGLAANQIFDVTVVNTNDAPIVAAAIADQSAQATHAFSFQLPQATFTDEDAGDTLSFTATLANGHVLPAWLTFNAATQTFSGTPGNLNVGAVQVKVTATDSSGAFVTDQFKISVAASAGTITGSGVSDNLVGSDGNDVIDGRGGTDTIAGGGGNDIITGGAAADTIDGGTGSDVVHGNGGNDVIAGGTGNDLITGDGGNDTLDGQDGNDAVQGGTGADTLTDRSGNNLLDAGAGADVLNAFGANNVVIGGKGADNVNLGAGNDLVAFNRGDGDDVIHSAGGGTDTLSLGGAMDRSLFTLQKTGDDLKMNLGNSDTILFKDWYSDGATHSFVNLQIVNEATANYDPASSDVTRDNKVERFNFANLVNAFDAARAANSHLNRWNLMDGLLSSYLGGDDNAALGGDLAYRYGVDGTLAGIGFDPTQALLANSQLTTNPTALSPVASLKTGDQRLS